MSEITEQQERRSLRARLQRRTERFLDRFIDEDPAAAAPVPPADNGAAITGLVCAVLGLTVALVVAYTIGGVKLVKDLAYVGVLVSAVIGSASMFVPVPGALAGITVGLTLDPIPIVPLPQEIVVALIVAGGSAIGELTGYSAGVGGRSVIGHSRIGKLLVTLMRKHGTLTVFCVAAVPNPFIDVGGIAAGVAGMTMRRFMTVMFIGKTINYIAVAYAVSGSVEGLQRWFGT